MATTDQNPKQGATINKHFKLRETKGKTESSIYLFIYFNKGKLRYSTGAKINPAYWNETHERPFQKSDWNTKENTFYSKTDYPKLTEKPDGITIQNLNDIEFILNRFRNETDNIFSYFLREKITPTIEQIKSEYDKIFHPIPIEEKEEMTLNKYIEQYIKDIETGKKLTGGQTGERFKLGTIKNYKGFQTQFNEFQLDPRDRPKPPKVDEVKPKRKHIKKVKPKDPVKPIEPKFKKKALNFDDITMDFYNEFCSFFTLKNYSPNTIGRHVKNLKTIMRSARDDGFHQNFKIENKNFITKKEEVQNIYLTEKEIDILHKLDLSDNLQLDQARDIFLIGCYTAQRFSDFATISEKNLKTFDNGTRVLTLIQKKTGTEVFIPIRPELDEILQKYQYHPPKIFEQQLNARIKEVGKLAKISDNTQKEEIRGGYRVKRDVKKYEQIKTHTARRSGITNMYLGGIPTLDIMKISGHKTEKEFLKYIKITNEESAKKTAVHPYFNNFMKIAK